MLKKKKKIQSGQKKKIFIRVDYGLFLGKRLSSSLFSLLTSGGRERKRERKREREKKRRENFGVSGHESDSLE